VNKNDFSFVANGITTRFDFAYITIHGTPGEDGVLQGYFDMLGIPYSNCGVLTSALTFNKFTCNNFLKNFGVKVAPSIVLRGTDSYAPEQIANELGLPVFVKPNSGGSSFATTKVTAIAEMKSAIEKAFLEAPEVIIEQFIAARR
jgi:D-alanine-D-alanine ligase